MYATVAHPPTHTHFLIHIFFNFIGAGMLAQQLKILVALVEALGSISSPMVAHNPL